MQNIFSNNSLPLLFVLGIAGICAVAFYIYKFINKQAYEKQLAELRKKLEELKPTDPEYNQVRALYTSLMIDAHTSTYLSSATDGSDTSSVDHGTSGDMHGHHVGSDN